MHKNFGEWYGLASIPRSHEILTKRWAGVESWVTTVNRDIAALLETVRIFRGFPEKTSRERFLEAFRKHDAAFAQRNNAHEQQVLAGATLVHSVLTHEKSDEDSVRIAQVAGAALEASGLCSAENSLDELAGEVRAGLYEIGHHQRRRRGFDAILLTSDEEAALTKTIETNPPDLVQLRANFASAFQTLLKAVNRSETALGSAAHDLRCADEETNILWWLAGGSSRDLNRPWGALKDAVPLVAAWELADLTDVALGTRDAGALLDRVVPEAKGGKSKDQALQTYVNAVPEEWAKARVAKVDARALDLAPLTLALSKRVEGNTTTWQPFFEAVCGLKTATAMAPERVARLAYVEAMLFRTLSMVEN